MSKFIIISRHPAAVQFVREELPQFADAPVLATASEEDVKGKVVAGNIPLYLACLAEQVVAIEFSGPPPRGQEYSIEDMRAAGADLRGYHVCRACYLPGTTKEGEEE